MARAQYIVVADPHGWVIRFDEKLFGPYKDQQTASLMAIKTAEKAAAVGYDAEVLLQGDDGRLFSLRAYEAGGGQGSSLKQHQEELRTPVATAPGDADLRNRIEAKRRALYAGLEYLGEVSCLQRNAEIMADRIAVSPNVLDYLFANSRARMPRECWEREVRLAISRDTILRDHFVSRPLKELAPLIDGDAAAAAVQRLGPSGGSMLLTFRGGFSRFALHVFEGLFEHGCIINGNGAGPRRTSEPRATGNDRDAALFAAMRVLSQGQQLLIVPDDPLEGAKRSVQILCVTCQISEIAAFLPYETGCDTAWFTLSCGANGFSPVIEPGPKREDDEPYPSFRDRLLAFYAAKVEEAMTGDPRNLALSGRWISQFRASLTHQKQ